MPNFVSHGELTVEQIAIIKRDLLMQANHEPFWDRFCSHEQYEASHDSVETRKLVMPKLTLEDIKNLEEGITPAPEKMTYVKFKFGVNDFGRYIEYTDKSKRYNYDDVVRDAKSQLGDEMNQELELRKGRQFLQTACTLTPNADFLDLLSKARVVLKKNKGMTVSGGKYICIIPAEYTGVILKTYKDSITHTSQKEALINGYIGELGGFILYDTISDVIYSRDGKFGNILFLAKSKYGMPVRTVAIGNANVEVIDKGLGSVPQKATVGDEVRPDALNQRGTVGVKVMGFGTRIIDDGCVLRTTIALDKITEGVDIDDTLRSDYDSSSSSPTIETLMTVTTWNSATQEMVDAPTITLKKGKVQDSGQSVVAKSAGVYAVEAGDYNISITKAGFEDKKEVFHVTTQDVAKPAFAKGFAMKANA